MGDAIINVKVVNVKEFEQILKSYIFKLFCKFNSFQDHYGRLLELNTLFPHPISKWKSIVTVRTRVWWR